MDESLRVLAPGEAKGLFAFLQDSVGSTVVDVMRGEHRDPGMSMLGVVTYCARVETRSGWIGLVHAVPVHARWHDLEEWVHRDEDLSHLTRARALWSRVRHGLVQREIGETGHEHLGEAASREPPGADAIGETLGAAMPGYWTVERLDLTPPVDYGNAVEPDWRWRFEAAITPKETLYTELEKLNDVVLLQPTLESGGTYMVMPVYCFQAFVEPYSGSYR